MVKNRDLRKVIGKNMKNAIVDAIIASNPKANVNVAAMNVPVTGNLKAIAAIKKPLSSLLFLKQDPWKKNQGFLL